MRRLVLALLLAGTPVAAVEPDEVLDDPALEARARELGQELRCLVCRNESIDESSADLARDLRLVVRERLVAGDTDAEVMDFVVDRYGEFVLLRPQATGANLILWIAGPAMLAIGIATAIVALRRRPATSDGATTLTPEEESRLREVLDRSS